MEATLIEAKIRNIRKLPLDKVVKMWNDLEKMGRKANNLDRVVKLLCLNDLAYLLIRVCRRKDLAQPWFYERIREVEAKPNGHLDLWAREHAKSSIITFGQTISDILNNPDEMALIV